MLIGFNSDLSAQCEENLHTPFFGDGWLSCELTQNPNPERGMSHWIQFDFGETYVLDTMYVWNYNFWGYQQLGVKRMAVDYSLDGIIWTASGIYDIPQSTSSHKYEGTEGPIFDNISARYIILTALETWGDIAPCAGLAEVKFSLGEMSTSAEEILSAETQMKISPNPATDKINISIKGTELPEQIQIVDVNGRAIQSLQKPVLFNVPVDISRLPSGIYFARLIFENGMVSERFMKSDG